MSTDSTRDDDALPGHEVIEFTTPKARARTEIATPVVLCGEEFTAHRPKDAVLFFAQSALADVANDADRALAMLQLLDAALPPADRHRVLQRACERQDPVTAGAVYGMIQQLLDRWSPDNKVPSDAVVIVEPVPDSAPAASPVQVVNDDLGLDLECHPPKDLILHITASALATSANQGQQAWCVMLFLDAALSQQDAVMLDQRIRSARDPLDLEALLVIIQTLMQRWYPELTQETAPSQPNRSQRRAQAKKTKSQGDAGDSGTQVVGQDQLFGANQGG